MLSYMDFDMNVRHGNLDGSLVVPDKWYAKAFGGVNMARKLLLVGQHSEQDGPAQAHAVAHVVAFLHQHPHCTASHMVRRVPVSRNKPGPL